MGEAIEELRQLFQDISFELVDVSDEPETEDLYISVSNIKGNPEIEFTLADDDDIETFKSSPIKDSEFLTNMYAFYHDKNI